MKTHLTIAFIGNLIDVAVVYGTIAAYYCVFFYCVVK